MAFRPAFQACREILLRCSPIKNEWCDRGWWYYQLLRPPVLHPRQNIIYCPHEFFSQDQRLHPIGGSAYSIHARETLRFLLPFFPYVRTCGQGKLLCYSPQIHPCHQNNQECRGSVCSRSDPCGDAPPSYGHLLFFSWGVVQ